MATSLHSALATAKNQLASSNAWIFLLQIDFTIPEASSLYLARATEKVTFDGQTWQPFPFQVGDINIDSDGNLLGVDCAAFDISGLMRKWMEEFEFDGAATTLRVVESGNLTDPTRSIDQDFTIRGWRRSYEQVTFQLGHQDFMTQAFPGRNFVRTRCSWVYKGVECAYAGTLPTCARVLGGGNGCEAHDNTPRFGGAPAIPRGRSV